MIRYPDSSTMARPTPDASPLQSTYFSVNTTSLPPHHHAHYDHQDSLHPMTITVISLGLTSILLNLLFLAAVHILREKSTTSNCLMQNMSLADGLAALMFLLTQYVRPGGQGGKGGNPDVFSCEQSLWYAFRSTPWMCFTAYLLTLMMLSVSQYLAVCRPSKYGELITRRNSLVCIALIWLLASVQTLVPLVVVLAACLFVSGIRAVAVLRADNVEMQIWMTLFTLSALSSVALNLLVHRRIRRLQAACHRTFHDHAAPTRFPPSLSPPSRPSPPHPLPLNERQSLRVKRDAVVTVTSLLVVSVTCRLPFPLVALGVINLGPLLSEEASDVVNQVIVILLYVNFLADPVIYVVRMTEMRKIALRFARNARGWYVGSGESGQTPMGGAAGGRGLGGGRSGEVGPQSRLTSKEYELCTIRL